MNAQNIIQREILPIPDIPSVRLTTYDAKDPDTCYPPIEPLRPPKNAPNVLIILIDDTGFGASSAFGLLCIENSRLIARAGLRPSPVVFSAGRDPSQFEPPSTGNQNYQCTGSMYSDFLHVDSLAIVAPGAAPEACAAAVPPAATAWQMSMRT